MTAVTEWEQAYQRFETPEQERRKFIRRLRSLGVHEWSRDTRVLEICSGRGNGLIAWRRLGFSNVFGVDLSPALVERSESRRWCVVGDARRLPISTASRDVAIVQGGLHHLLSLDDVREALGEMRRVLKPDGRVIIIAEPALTGADCRVEWANGGIERDLASTFASIEQSAERWRASTSAEEN